MSKYILKRLVISLLTLLVIIFVLFLMLDLMPGSPFNDEKLTEAQKIALYAKYGLDQPFFIRFLKYLQNMLHGDLGVSYVINKNRNVTDLLGNPLLVSIRIGAQAMVIGSILGLLLGIAAALHHNSWIDSLCSIVSILGVSIPSYVFALLLAYYIGFKLKWAPILYNSNNPVNSSVLPTIALAMFPMANISRFARSEMIDVLSSDYISLVEAKGVRERPLIMHHALRNTMIPLVTIMGPLLVNLLTGSMVVEKVFAIPGIGMLMVQAIQSNDYNVVIACAFVYSAMYIIMMLIVDILYGVIDPRIRVAKGEK
ncbi:ABC transporter permease [Erysipelotrichaceae bacterium Oil+RF-744-GAM-WT-6]|jgi:oligopeptide transport system permease protein|uniref:ABC transporter permease n=1 Tax=Stecheria intestinalis TaxID=2606630 RepID=A0A7X2NT51_9FIRM|nr:MULTISPECIES: ABC transporter permease [Erysipelotrichaceae]MCI2155168.1 ABC transporter permease [Solobacterium sp.]MDD6365640.1 ABC transporter permease [Stecheria intestinalis]MDD7679823.1 ABC transporter permease [Stecheria intestinalis]MSS59065.1 ABC transporter permease [Stecheria intestinalis]